MADSNEPAGWSRIRIDERMLTADLRAGTSLAIEQRFDSLQPRAFGAPSAAQQPLVLPGFNGRVVDGASCNCSTLTLTPHCNGTHTECVGHLTADALDAQHVVPAGPLLAVLLSVTPTTPGNDERAASPREQDRLITRDALETAWQAWEAAKTAQGGGAAQSKGDFDRQPLQPRALILRTLPNLPDKRQRDYDANGAAYLSPEAAHWLVSLGIEHLIVDLPSVDRMRDDGALVAHRIFFGLPARSVTLAEAQRAHCTISELAFVPDTLPDGYWLLWLQIPALAGDALPSRPMIYPVRMP